MRGVLFKTPGNYILPSAMVTGTYGWHLELISADLHTALIEGLGGQAVHGDCGQDGDCGDMREDSMAHSARVTIPLVI
jgi:hypothetical protein